LNSPLSLHRHDSFLEEVVEGKASGRLAIHPHGLRSVEENGVVASDGKRLPADVLVYATGFKVGSFGRMRIVGSGGEEISGSDVVNQAAPAYMVPAPLLAFAFLC
jgi:hypothetical protein